MSTCHPPVPAQVSRSSRTKKAKALMSAKVINIHPRFIQRARRQHYDLAYIGLKKKKAAPKSSDWSESARRMSVGFAHESVVSWKRDSLE